MKFVKFTSRDNKGNFVISRKHFIWLNLTGGIGLGLLFLLAFTYYFNGGNYLPGADIIYFFGKNYTPDELHYIADHEIGHHVWFVELNDEQRKEYNQIFDNSDKYITKYSETNVEENFAEEYAFYRECGAKLFCISNDRVNFFKNHVIGYNYVFID